MMKRMLLLLIFLFACYKTYDIKTQFPTLYLSLVDSLWLPNPVAAIGLDTDGGILALEALGNKILKLSSNLILFDSIVMPERIFYPKGIKADNFFIYIYTDNNFYRFDRQNKTLNTILSGVKADGMVVVNTNEVYLADPLNHRIILVDATGLTKDFVTQVAPTRFEPTAMTYDAKNGMIWVINNQNRAIEAYNRIGNLKASIAIFNYTFDKIALDNDNNLYLLGKNGTSVWRISQKGEFKLFKGTQEGNFVGTDILLSKERLYILDYQNRILSFQLPR